MNTPNNGRKGKKPRNRPVDVEAKTSNQYVSNPRQDRFLDLYLSISSPTFGNAYKSALQAGYSEGYARQITAPEIGNEWIRDDTRLKKLEPRHIELMIEEIASNNTEKTTDRLKALELAAKLKGMLIERKQVQQEVLHISLGLDKSFNKAIINTED